MRTMTSTPTFEFFTNKGLTKLSSGPWTPSYILDSQVVLYMSTPAFRDQFPLPYLRDQLSRDHVEGVNPWYGLYELTKQRKKVDEHAFYAGVRTLFGPTHPLSTGAEDALSGILGGLHNYFDTAVPHYAEVVEALYRLNDEVEATRKTTIRKAAFVQFLADNQHRIEHTLGLGMLLGLRLVARCPLTTGLLKIDEARKTSYAEVASNVAFDLSFLKTVHVANKPNAKKTRRKTVLVTADTHLRKLAAVCTSTTPEGNPDKIFMDIKLILPKDGPLYVDSLRPYVDPSTLFKGRPL